MPAKTNRLKTNNTENDKPKTQRKVKKKSNFLKNFTGFFRNRQFQQILGIFMVLFAVFLAFSFTSYWSAWKADDTLLSAPFWDILLDRSVQVENVMGKFGAILSGMFIKQGFGAASYFFIIWFFLTGIKLFRPSAGFSAWKVSRYCLLGLVWFSATFAYLFPNYFNGLLGGSFGLYVNEWMVAGLGMIGTGLILLFVALSFLVIAGFFTGTKKNPFTFTFSGKKSRKKEKKNEKNTPGKSDKYNVEEYYVADDDTPDEDESKTPAGDGENIELDVETGSQDEKDEQEKQDTSDIDLIIENPEVKQEENASETSVSSETQKAGKDRQGLDTIFDPTLDLPHFQFPTLDLLNDYGSDQINVQKEELETNKNKIVETLKNYQISIQKIKATIGPTVTLYEIVPAPGVRISKIKNLEDDIALSLAALGIRIIAPIPGKGTIGIEVPNRHPDIVSMKSVLASDKFQNTKYELPFGMGKTISNEVFVADLTKMPHILMAGATGQGKSVGLNAIIASFLFKKHPAELKFVMVDPKKVELSLFSKIERHYLAKLPDAEEAIITDTRKVVRTLNSLGIEMDTRYELLKDAQVRNIKEYNVKYRSRKLNPGEGHHFMPYIVLVIDEFADLIMTAGKEIEVPLTRLAQLARAVGIHLIIATQRPSVNIITGSIKANFPARIAFRVTAKVDSRTILDTQGADQLIGRGDMLLSNGSDLIRLQCAFIDTPEIEKLTDFIGSQRAYPDAYHLPEFADDQDEPITDFDPDEKDALFEDAARIIVQNQQGSTSLLQRKMKIGYNRAGRIIDQLEAAGIVGHFEGSKARDVLIHNEIELEQFLKDMEQ